MRNVPAGKQGSRASCEQHVRRAGARLCRPKVAELHDLGGRVEQKILGLDVAVRGRWASLIPRKGV